MPADKPSEKLRGDTASVSRALQPDLSIVIPVFNEEQNLDMLHERLTDALRSCGHSYELLFIEDGSTDRSYAKLRELYERDESVRVVRFIRNFGQQMGISAGLKHARGEAVVLFDADLQVPPEEIPKLLDKLAEGYDIVYGVRSRRIDPVLRRIGSWCMSHLLYRVLGIDIPDSVTGFIALDRRFVDTVNLFNEKSRYLSGLFAWLSYGRWASVPVVHEARHAGESKYSIVQLAALTLNFVCLFTVQPLRLAMYVGVPAVVLSGAGLLWLILAAMVGLPGSGSVVWPVVAVVVFFAGVQLITVGIMGEYLGRVYREVRQQPPYVVSEILDRDGFGD